MARVMHAVRHGELRRNDGGVVIDPKQAIAVALSEAGASDRVGERIDRRALRRTRIAEARPRSLPGRPRMTKADLQRALSGSSILRPRPGSATATAPHARRDPP